MKRSIAVGVIGLFLIGHAGKSMLSHAFTGALSLQVLAALRLDCGLYAPIAHAASVFVRTGVKISCLFNSKNSRQDSYHGAINKRVAETVCSCSITTNTQPGGNADTSTCPSPTSQKESHNCPCSEYSRICTGDCPGFKS